MTTEQQIKELAHSVWEKEGRPEGKDVEYYFRAKEILEKQEATRVIELGPPTLVPELSPSAKESVEGYCLKCRVKRVMKDARMITFKNGRVAIQGICLVCSTKMSKLGQK